MEEEYVTGVHPNIAPPAPDAAAGFAERLALRVLQLAAIAIVFAVSIRKVFDLDRFLAPKELVLHLAAFLAGLLLLSAFRRVVLTKADFYLILYLILGALSTLLATNRWIAMRALAVSISSVGVFWAARALRTYGLERKLLAALSIAVALAAISSLLQAYGVRLEIFSLNRSPGGTLGNRNFVAHAAAFGFPILLTVALRARRTSRYLLTCAAAALTIWALVLTRSRAAWLAFAAVVIVFAFAIVLSRALRRDWHTWKRMAGLVVFAAGGVAAALLLPNTLRWRSDNPYLDTMKNVASYDEGSGHGRLVQYGQTLLMALRHPLLGVGPGNWAVRYAEHPARRDPSLDPSEGGMTMNPWPSSDWAAALAERGIAAFVLLLLVFLGLAMSALRRLLAAQDPDDALLGTALLGTVAGAVVTGAFDAVLLLALPAFLVWSALGAMWSPETSPVAPRTSAYRVLALLVVAIAAGAATMRSAGQIAAMEIYATSGSRASLERAAQLDPGNYRVQMRLARSGGRKLRCEHAKAALALYPNADAARAAARGCPE